MVRRTSGGCERHVLVLLTGVPYRGGLDLGTGYAAISGGVGILVDILSATGVYPKSIASHPWQTVPHRIAV